MPVAIACMSHLLPTDKLEDAVEAVADAVVDGVVDGATAVKDGVVAVGKGAVVSGVPRPSGQIRERTGVRVQNLGRRGVITLSAQVLQYGGRGGGDEHNVGSMQ